MSTYRSGFEENVALFLTRSGVAFSYEASEVPYRISYKYIPDFTLTAHNIILECKGYWSASDRRKIRAVRETNPDLDLRMVFQSPENKISRNSRTTYGGYCDKLGIPWSNTNIPSTWLHP
ncbi:hypothetical protein OMCYN_01664 [cyanobiont of Ornithocercus magnificus]|nr:hypothetical protein OMCYN_01664 [cyanobiont of Ornithocercus magnificus]